MTMIQRSNQSLFSTDIQKDLIHIKILYRLNITQAIALIFDYFSHKLQYLAAFIKLMAHIMDIQNPEGQEKTFFYKRAFLQDLRSKQKIKISVLGKILQINKEQTVMILQLFSWKNIKVRVQNGPYNKKYPKNSKFFVGQSIEVCGQLSSQQNIKMQQCKLLQNSFNMKRYKEQVILAQFLHNIRSK